MKSLLLLLVYLILPTWAMAQQTPSAASALRFEPYEFDRGTTFDAMESACLAAGYSVTSRRQTTAETNPTIGLGSLTSNLSGYGVTAWASHSSAKGIAAQAHSTSTSRDNAYGFALGHGWTTAEIYPASSSGGYHISITAAAIATRYAAASSIVYVRGCDSLPVVAAGFVGARYYCSYSGNCTTGVADATSFWNSLGDGNPASTAISGTSLTYGGNNSTILALMVNSSPSYLAIVPPGGKEFVWTFNGPGTGVLSGDSFVSVASQSWSGNTLTAMLTPVSPGIGYITASITSANGITLSHPTKQWGFYHGHNPAASVNGFSVISDGGLRAFWQVDSESQTTGYKIQTSQNPSGSWSDSGIMQPAGLSSYVVSLSSVEAKYFRLVEIETSGNEIVLATTKSSPRRETTPEPVQQSADFFAKRIVGYSRSLQQSISAGEQVIVGGNINVTFFTIPEVADAVENGIASLWNILGHNTEVVSTATWPSNPDDFRSRLRAEMSVRNGSTMLIGGANDWQQSRFDQVSPPLLWQSNGWDSIWQSYKNSGYLDQSFRDRLPTNYREATEARNENGAWYVPFWYTDWPYADFNGDDIPDAVITRLPFNDPEQVWAFADKMWQSQMFGAWGPAGNVSLMVGDYDNGGDLALATANTIAGMLPPDTQLSHLYQSEVLSDALRNDAAASLINIEKPQLIVGLAGLSNRSWPMRMFDQTIVSNPWSMSALWPTDNFPLVLAISCDTGDFARTWHPSYGSPIMEKFLSYRYGARAWVGNNLGTWSDANDIVARYMIEELYLDPMRPMAESALVALQRILTDYADTPHVKYTALSCGFYGDPLSRMSRPMVATGNPNGATRLYSLLQNNPNPFNPSTRIQYAVDGISSVELKIYDAHGRLVKTLVSVEELKAGVYTSDWRGDDDQGQKVASGVYYYQLTTDDTSLSKKMTLLK